MSEVLSFLFPFFLILGLVLFALTWPFWRKDPSPISFGHDDDRAQERADLQVERETLGRSLHDLEMEVTQGRMERADYDRLKATDERRLLQVLDRLEDMKDLEDSPNKEASQQGDRKSQGGWIRAVASGLVVLLASLGIYGVLQFQQGQKILAAQERMGGGPNPLEMVAKLEARLKENPDDLQGQIMAGRSYQALDRLTEAKKAWEKVLELDPTQNEAHYNLGVVMIETRKFDDPELFKAALAHFDTVLKNLPDQPAVNWYRGLALWYLDRKQETEASWILASQQMEPGSKDAAFVQDALTKLRAGQVPF